MNECTLMIHPVHPARIHSDCSAKLIIVRNPKIRKLKIQPGLDGFYFVCQFLHHLQQLVTSIGSIFRDFRADIIDELPDLPDVVHRDFIRFIGRVQGMKDEFPFGPDLIFNDFKYDAFLGGEDNACIPVANCMPVLDEDSGYPSPLRDG